MSPGAPTVAVAVSGGRDSTALLHCTLRAAAPLGLGVLALHVNHGLVAEADAWQAQVQRQAKRWGAGFLSTRLAGRPEAGESVEAWARRERYLALATMAAGAACPLVLLAHHRRDQAETFMLQALRGGGPAGLAAMPAEVQRHGLQWARPWLGLPREAVEAYVRRHRLRHVDDASNADPRFARNRLRLQVWPALTSAFADAEQTLAEASRQAAWAAALANEAAALDLPALAGDGTLDVNALRCLPLARRRNALQAWLVQVLAAPIPNSLLDRLFEELPGRSSGEWPAPQSVLRLHRGRLARHESRNDALPQAPVSRARQVLDLRHPGRIAVPGWPGSFEVLQVASGGVPLSLLREVHAAARRGGERFHLTPRGLARSVKKQCQAAGVPAWERQGPLLWLPDGRLLFVPGLGVDATLRAGAGQPQATLRWVAEGAAAGLPGPRQPPG